MYRFALLFLVASGCESLSPFAVPENKNIVKQGTLSPASHAAAERLDRVGRQILATNPFLTSAPAFGFVGTKAPEMYHQNCEAIFVSEGLIERCKTDDELAAVLCVELATITAESRNRARFGLPEPDTTLPGVRTDPDPAQADLGDAAAVGTASDPAKRIRALPVTDVNALAAEWHKNAGYKPDAFVKVESLLSLAGSNSDTAKQFGGTSAAPRWTQ